MHKSRKTKNPMLLFYVVFALVGAVMLGGGIAFGVVSYNFRQHAEKITAYVTDIRDVSGSDGETSRTAYVSYDFQGQHYPNVHLDYYSSSMHIGTEVMIWCSLRDPYDIQANSSPYIACTCFGIAGIICLAIGIVPGVFSLKKRTRKQKLLETGKTLYATVEYIDLNPNYTVNGCSPYVIYCTYYDAYANVTYRFKSDNLWTDPGDIFPTGSTITVYVDPQDYSKYHVNTENALSSKIIDYT